MIDIISDDTYHYVCCAWCDETVPIESTQVIPLHDDVAFAVGAVRVCESCFVEAEHELALAQLQ